MIKIKNKDILRKLLLFTCLIYVTINDKILLFPQNTLLQCLLANDTLCA